MSASNRREKVPRVRSPAEIERYATLLRELFSLGNEPYFDILQAVENDLSQALADFVLEVMPSDKLAPAEAATEFNPVRILVREDIYEGAHRDDPRSRFTIAHELGHLCLHWDYPRPRLAPEKQGVGRSPVNARIEAEANRFAGALLIPSSVARGYSKAGDLAKRCRVSLPVAERRLGELLQRSQESAPTLIRDLFRK
ncbi:ImmA/IrrE family metallo-endopeptidase [Bradyrhizobium sp.]|uniref:ImmA/IrrE family metallo-endopeptidase n=1 Tax=Bradyrhizobium sp. TaxID=376 RepID=UPI004037A163